eukprot:751898-Amphidinium_carterae.3
MKPTVTPSSIRTPLTTKLGEAGNNTPGSHLVARSTVAATGLSPRTKSIHWRCLLFSFDGVVLRRLFRLLLLKDEQGNLVLDAMGRPQLDGTEVTSLPSLQRRLSGKPEYLYESSLFQTYSKGFEDLNMEVWSWAKLYYIHSVKRACRPYATFDEAECYILN